MEYKDITIKCVEQTCELPNKEFIVTAGEQSFFASKGYGLPKRCKKCRDNKKNRENSPFKEVAKAFKNGTVKIGVDYSIGKDWTNVQFKDKRKNKRHQDHRKNGREKFRNIY